MIDPISLILPVLLAIGGYQDLREGRISRSLNYVVLGALPLALILCILQVPEVPLIALSCLATSFGILVMFIFSWIGAADAKFFILTLMLLGFTSPLQPLWFTTGAFLLWTVFPTKNGLKYIDPKVALGCLIVGAYDLFLGGLLAFTYLGLLRLNEVRLAQHSPTDCHFPFIHVLFLVTVLHLVVPDLLYFW
jgi:hypothetical protein